MDMFCVSDCSDAQICDCHNFRKIYFEMTGTKRSLSGESEVSECKRTCNIENNVQTPQVNICERFGFILIFKEE